MAAKAKQDLAARRPGDPAVYGRASRNRIRALIDEAIAGVTGPEGRRHASGATLIERMQDALLEAPIATLAALEKLLPVDPNEAQHTGGNVNIATLYLQAVRQAQPVVIEHDASGYIAGTEADKPLITLDNW